jgi:hypothetical protein
METTPTPTAPATGGNKNRNLLIGLGIAAFVCLIACIVAFFAFRMVGKSFGEKIQASNDPAQIATVADKIAKFEPPAGYTEQMGVDLGFYRMLALVPDDTSKPMIMLLGYNQSMGADSQQMQDQMQRSLEQQTGTPGVSWTTVDERTMTIRGQQVQVTVREGKAEGGFAMRQLFTIFEGENGTVMVMAQGDSASWDEEAIDQFLASIQ